MKIGQALRSFAAASLISTTLFAIEPSSATAATEIFGTCVGSSCTITATDSSTVLNWAVPAGVASVTFDIKGGSGGEGSYSTNGGKGAYFSGVFPVTQGATVSLYVGEGGRRGNLGADNYSLSGGRNSGGFAGNAPEQGGAGGACSEIKVGATTYVIAGGGGGGGGFGTSQGANAGSASFAGGKRAGDAGVPATANFSGVGGGAGGIGAGGAGGAGYGGGTAGTAGSLSLGGNGGGDTSWAGGGGGGCGYYGGGGGGGDRDVNNGWDGGSGGGGSSYYNTSIFTNVTPRAPHSDQNGSIVLTYTVNYTNITLSIAGNVKTVNKGIPIVLSAVIDQAGKVTFYADNKRIGKCISLIASVGTKTCSWKPAIQKSVTITATVIPTNAQYPTASTSLYVAAIKRTNNR